MNPEFTDEMLKKISADNEIVRGDMRVLAKTILSERAGRTKNPGVWDGAPDKATEVSVTWTTDGFINRVGSREYKREPPKPRAREIADLVAEKIRQELSCILTQNELRRVQAISESSILEYAESIK